MSQNIVNFSGDISGVALLDNHLTPMKQNILTKNSGTSRPAYAVAGTEWLDTTTNPWVVNLYDGAQDIIIGYVNAVTNAYIHAGGSVNGDLTLGAGAAPDTATAVAINASVAQQGQTGGFVNKFRNGAFDVAQRGTSGTITAGSSGYTIDGWILAATGANLSWGQGYSGTIAANILNLPCGAGITGASIKQRIESSVVMPLVNKRLTVQFSIYNNSGASITPTLTVKYANVIDNWSASTVEVNAVSLQPCANAGVTKVAYTFSPTANIVNGLEITLDLGAGLNQTGGGGIQVQIGKADIRATPGVTIGLNSTPPVAESRPIHEETVFCQRYFFSTFPNGTAPAQGASVNGSFSTIQGFPASVANQGSGSLRYPVVMRASPTVITYNPVSANSQPRNLTRAADTSAVAANIQSESQFAFTYTTSAGSQAGDINILHIAATAEL